MKYSVNLEAPFAFSARWYLIGLGLLLLGIVLWFAGGRLLDRLAGSNSEKVRWHRLSANKKKYLRRIEDIEAAHKKGELDTRAVCQQMSKEVRDFVDAVTGLRTGTMVYLELARLNRPELAELVRNYYEPEFSYYTRADAKAAIEEGKELIRKWA